TVTTTGFPTPTLTESASDTLPGGVNFDKVTGVLSGTPTAAGTFTLHFTASNGYGSDATQTFTLTVTPAPVTVAVTGTQVYGGTGKSFTPNYSGSVFVSPDTSSVVTGALLCSTSATPSSPVGTSYTVSACSGLSATNYAISYSYGAFSVTAAPVTVAVSGTQVYGGAGKSFTDRYSVGEGESADRSNVVTGTLHCSTSAIATSPVGTSYTISACSGLSATNYAISYSYGAFSVTAAPVTVAVTGTQVYGGAGKSF